MLYRRKHIPSNLSRIYVQPVIENMESNQHNPRIWNPNFETPKPGLTDSPESRGMTGHKQLRTGREKKSGINEWNTYRCKKQAGKGHLGRAIWSFSIAEQWRRMPDFRWQAQSRPIREAISQPWRPPWPCCNANQIKSIQSLLLPLSFLPSTIECFMGIRHRIADNSGSGCGVCLSLTTNLEWCLVNHCWVPRVISTHNLAL